MLINDALRGIEISRELKTLLQKDGQMGTVHSVFHSSVNLLINGQLITLLTESRPLYPYSLRIEGETLPPAKPDEAVEFSAGQISFPESGWKVLTAQARETDLTLASLPLAGLSSPDESRLSELRDIILRHGKTDGFAPLLCLLEEANDPVVPSNLYVDFAAHRIPALFQSIRSLDVEKAAEAAYSIAGCGIGLTPSADDFLCGLMTSLQMEALVRHETGRVTSLTAAMAEKAASRTNLVSGTFLREAGCGLVSQDVRELMKALYSSVLSQGVTTSAMNVIAFGETSGTDILTGIYFGQKNYPN